MTRRKKLAGTGAAFAAVGFGLWGRFAFGDNFEEHVADRLGLDQEIATGLLADMRSRTGSAEYDVRASGFLFATTEPSQTLMPGNIRDQTVRSYVGPLFGGLVTALTYAGLRDNTTYTPCEVLVSR